MTATRTAAEIVDGYLGTWNETDPVARRGLLARHFTADATYADPMALADGIDELEATIAAVQAQFPDFVFSSLGEPDAHHDQLRFRWGLGPAGAEPVIEGFDVVVSATDGRIRQVLGFLDRVPG